MAWEHPENKPTTIVKVTGLPNQQEEFVEKGRWERFFEFIFPFLKRGGRLGEAYADAKVAKEKGEADKIVEEAAEIAIRSEIARQNANILRQEATKKFNENVNDIFAKNDLPNEAKALKLAKLFEDNPDIEKQFNKICDLMEKLNLTKGTQVQVIVEESPISPQFDPKLELPSDTTTQ